MEDEFQQQPHSMYEDVEPLGRVMRLNNNGKFNFHNQSSSNNSGQYKLSQDGKSSNRSEYQLQMH